MIKYWRTLKMSGSPPQGQRILAAEKDKIHEVLKNLKEVF